MQRVYELDVYKLAEGLSDIECVHQQYKSMKAKFPISIFYFQRSVNDYTIFNGPSIRLGLETGRPAMRLPGSEPKTRLAGERL